MSSWILLCLLLETGTSDEIWDGGGGYEFIDLVTCFTVLFFCLFQLSGERGTNEFLRAFALI